MIADPFAASLTRLDQLAHMEPIHYEQIRGLEAEAMGVRVRVLDNEVQRRRADAQHDATSPVEDIEPWPEPVAGADLLQQLAETYTRYLVLPEHAATAAALWVLHTYAIDAATCSPFLCWQSPTRRCGKTSAQTITGALAAKAILTSNISTAAVFRLIDRHAPTLILDEADTFTDDNHELRGVLNSGHARAAAFVVRCVGDNHEPRRFSTWGAKSIALIGKLPATLLDRSIVVQMRRKLCNERLERFPSDPGATFKGLRSKSRRWADDHFHQLRLADPQAVPALNDRALDNWRSLLAIGEVVGGEWPERARAAAAALSGGDHDAVGVVEQLLADIHAYFHPKDDDGNLTPVRDRVRSYDLASALADVEGRPWAEWKAGKPISPNQIARLLADVPVVPKTVRFGPTDTAKGYEKRQFADAFARYLPDQAVSASQSHKNLCCDVSRDVTEEIAVTAPEPSQTYENRPCDAVTGQSGRELNEEMF